MAFIKTVVIFAAVAIFLVLWYKLCHGIDQSRPRNAVILPTSQVGNRYTIYITPPMRRDPMTIVRPPSTTPTNMTQTPPPHRPVTTTSEIAPLPLYTRNDDNNNYTTAATMHSAYPVLNTEENPGGGTNQDIEGEQHFPSIPPPAYTPAYTPADETTFPSSLLPSLQSPAVSNETGTPGTVQAPTPGPGV